MIPSLFTEVLLLGISLNVQLKYQMVKISETAYQHPLPLSYPPKIENVTLSPDPIYTNDLVTATVDAYDSAGDTIDHFQWYVDGIEVKSGLGGTLDGVDYFDKEQEIPSGHMQMMELISFWCHQLQYWYE